MSQWHFDPQTLVEESQKESGVDLPLGARIRVGLEKYCEAVNEPTAQLHEAGIVTMRDKIKRYIKNNLRMQRDIAAHPEILDEQITGPIICSGTGRCGTSKLQKVLAASGSFNYVPLWQSLYPSLLTGDRNESPAGRIQLANEWIEWNCSLSPHFMEGHTFEAESADEELFILEQNFECTRLYIHCPIPTYQEWVMKQDPHEVYRYLKKVLQYLQWQGPAQAGKTWLLKSPMHCGYEHICRDVFPDVKFVMPHRDPAESSSSSYRMMQSFRDPFSSAQFVGEISLEDRARHILSHLVTRNAHPEIPFLDLDYRDLEKDSELIIDRIYDFAGMPLTETARENIRNWELSNPKGKHGKHKHSLDAIGASRDDVHKAYAPYIDFMQVHGFLN
jgi:hypothetical protein